MDTLIQECIAYLNLYIAICLTQIDPKYRPAGFPYDQSYLITHL